MPRKREQEVFKYQELSSEAKEKARDHYRESMFDADHISEQFKSILVERGFKDSGGAFDVNWSLGYCQGDGVCFWGHIDLPTFFKWALKGDDPKYTEEMKGKVEPFVSLEDVVSVRVRHEGRNCHWNSMEVLVELTGGVMDLVPKDKRDEVLSHLEERERAQSNYNRRIESVRQERFRPVRDWERRKEERERSTRKGPKEWRPNVFLKKPEPLDILDPIKDIPELPPHVKMAFDKAHAEWQELETRLPAFEEFMKEWVEDTSRELEKMGYDEIEYQESGEALEEFFDANEIEFEKDGTPVK